MKDMTQDDLLPVADGHVAFAVPNVVLPTTFSDILRVYYIQLWQCSSVHSSV